MTVVFPFMQKVDHKRFLVIGSGAIALRKVRLLLQFTDKITLVTHSDTRHDLSGLEQEGIEVLDRHFTPQDLQKADYCIASSDSSLANRNIAALCREADLPVNVPDDPDSCTFFMPSVIRKGNLVITVSTGGSSPAMSVVLRQKIEDMLPPNTEEILDLMEELRAWAPSRLPRSLERGRLYAYILARLMDGSLTPTEKNVHEAAAQWIEESIDRDD